MLAVHIVGKKLLGHLVTPNGVLELVILVADLNTPGLQLKLRVPAFYVSGKTVCISAGQLYGFSKYISGVIWL